MFEAPVCNLLPHRFGRRVASRIERLEPHQTPMIVTAVLLARLQAGCVQCWHSSCVAFRLQSPHWGFICPTTASSVR